MKPELTKERLVVGKYYKNDEVICDVTTEEMCWSPDENFCDTGVLGEHCLKCHHLVIVKDGQGDN